MKIFGQQRDGCVPANKIGTDEDVHRWITQSQWSPQGSCESSDGHPSVAAEDDTCSKDGDDDHHDGDGTIATASLLKSLTNKNDGLIVAQLDCTQIETGKLLGTGSFSNVFQITRLHEASHIIQNGSDRHGSSRNTIKPMNTNSAATAASWLQGKILKKKKYTASSKTTTSKNKRNNQATTATTTLAVDTANHEKQGDYSSSSLPAKSVLALERQKEETTTTTTIDPPPVRTNYAVKVLNKELLKNKRVFKAAAEDLMTEAMYLIRCRGHPNILQIRGVPSAGVYAWKENNRIESFFIMTDRLDRGTLDERMEEWKQRYYHLLRCDTTASTSSSTPVVVLNSHGDLCRKMRYAWQICNALSYLHKQKIIYRDLKPENIGFIADRKQQAGKMTTTNDQQCCSSHTHHCEEGGEDERIQLFDLGLCRDLNSFPKVCVKRRRGVVGANRINNKTSIFSAAKKTSMAQINNVGVVRSCRHDEPVHDDKDDKQSDNYDDDDGYTAMYNIPVMSGSLRYMAGEIFLTEGKCNLKSDIYSWALVFYEMLSLEVVFEGYSRRELKEMVWIRGCRPSLSKSEGLSNLISPITTLLKKAWSKYPSRRPTSKQCCQALEAILVQIDKISE